MFSTLKIAARKTTLAKIQAYMVGAAIRRFKQEKPMEYLFKESSGDKDLESPLWKMESKGVFTRDFREDLLNDKYDMVVHSWKDIDLEDDGETVFISVLGRADQRDILLFKRDSLNKSGSSLHFLTSSPRRQYNLLGFFKEYLPSRLHTNSIEFLTVRGSIQKRIEKWLNSDSDGLILAKAAIDRFLDTSFPESNQDEFRDARTFIQKVLKDSLFMCIPLSQNPNAAAQGGLVVEIKKDREDLKRILSKITLGPIRDSIEEERKILGSHGGGCHQKIGVGILIREYGKILYKKGLTDSGEVLNSIKLVGDHQSKARDLTKIWPLRDKGLQFRRYISKPLNLPPSGNLLITRVNSWQDHWKFNDVTGIIWCSGLKTMKELAKKDIWVSGCLDGLGEYENLGIEKYISNPEFSKITHELSEEIESRFKRIFTYSIELIGDIPDLKDKTHFYWMSGYQFDLALSRYPSIINANHASGPGITRFHIMKKINKPVDVFLSHEDWINYHTGTET